ncbi:hypothetical protein R1flu_025104 [Riccia fluitans]|uniref:Ribosomal protein S14 n=1 Tax=Riccia fluitans TaxID=41844 RepID=A0ABD1XWT3_9MARC
MNVGTWMSNNLAVCERFHIPTKVVQLLAQEEQQKKPIRHPSPVIPLSAMKTLKKNAKYRAVCDFAATRKRISLQYNFSAGTYVIGELIAATR